MRWIFSLLLVSLSLTADEPKKVLFVTIPKSGTNLLIKAIKQISGVKAKWISASKCQSPDYPHQLLKSDIKYHITHLFPTTDALRTLDAKRCTKVLLIRDPRAVMISFLYHVTQKGSWPFSPVARENRQLKQLPFDEQLQTALLSPPMGPHHSIPCAVTWRHDPDVVVLRFEDLIGSRGGGSDEAQRAALYTLANCMGISLTPEKVDEIAANLFGGTWTFRSGQIGGWESAYNAENKELFKSLLGQATIDLGYATDLNW